MITKTEIRKKLHARKYVFPKYKTSPEFDGQWYADDVASKWFKKIEAYFDLDLERRAPSSVLEAYVHKNPSDESVHEHCVAEIVMLTVHLQESRNKHDVKRKFDSPTVSYRQQKGASRAGIVMRQKVFTPLGKYLLMSRVNLWTESASDRPTFDPDWSDPSWSDSDSDESPPESHAESRAVYPRLLRLCDRLMKLRPERPRTTRSMTRTGYAAWDEVTFGDFMQLSVSDTITKTSWKRERTEIEPEWKQSQLDYDVFESRARMNEEWIRIVFDGDTRASDFEENPNYVEVIEETDAFFAGVLADPAFSAFSEDERRRLTEMLAKD